MHVFDFVVILNSFIYALALSHLLSRIGALLLAPERVKFSGLTTLMAVNAVWATIFCWLGLWQLHTLPDWDMATILSQFFLAIALYFLAVFAAPEGSENRTIDTEAFYWAQHRRFYWTYLIADIIGILGNVAYLRSADPALFLKWNLASLPMFLPSILALTVRARWAQWTAGIGLLIITVGVVLPIEAQLT
ncbi:MAG: hypothetical protein JO348_09320 [Alphaproteobacteria bacterium]|nr:hypothetical protein [Alphaproteobacteria bacterium]